MRYSFSRYKCRKSRLSASIFVKSVLVARSHQQRWGEGGRGESTRVVKRAEAILAYFLDPLTFQENTHLGFLFISFSRSPPPTFFVRFFLPSTSFLLPPHNHTLTPFCVSAFLIAFFRKHKVVLIDIYLDFFFLSDSLPLPCMNICISISFKLAREE